MFHLYKSRSTSDEGVYKVRKDAHDQAERFLKDLASGKAGLDVPTIEETATSPGTPDAVLRGSSESTVVFSDDKLAGY